MAVTTALRSTTVVLLGFVRRCARHSLGDNSLFYAESEQHMTQLLALGMRCIGQRDATGLMSTAWSSLQDPKLLCVTLGREQGGGWSLQSSQEWFLATPARIVCA